MTEPTYNKVQMRAMAATWYAWGRKDERRGQPSGVGFADDEVDPMHFGAWAAKQLLGEPTFVPSIQDQWKKYLERR